MIKALEERGVLDQVRLTGPRGDVHLRAEQVLALAQGDVSTAAPASTLPFRPSTIGGDGMSMSTSANLYQASPIKRKRATKAEMEERAEFLIAYAEEHGPVTVRQLYYQAEVHGLPGIDKTDKGYGKIQKQVLNLRRAGRLDYEHISDATRWMRKPRSFEGVEEALADTARLYRKASGGRRGLRRGLVREGCAGWRDLSRHRRL